MPLGFADAAVIACAERRGGKVLTYDQRHFSVVAREGTIQIVGGP
jgi:predicted nucleic acid-binding protein